MKWEGGEESENVEDRRGSGGDDGGDGGGNGLGGLNPAHLGIGAGTIIVLLIGYFLGVDPRQLAQLLNGGQNSNTRPISTQVASAPRNDRALHFAKTILDYTETVWDEQFKKMGKVYTHPKLVLFDGTVQTGCGPATAAVGPFYCPADKKVYLDPTFYDELEGQLGGSKADFSQAYVIAHEIGHHVQGLLGYADIVDQKRRELSKEEFNKWSVRLELQADYLAGVWAHYANEKYHLIEPGDVEAAVKSANAIGDDTLQRNATGRISPQNYTHGTSAQRVKWFKKGLETGDFSQLKVIFDAPYDQL